MDPARVASSIPPGSPRVAGLISLDHARVAHLIPLDPARVAGLIPLQSSTVYYNFSCNEPAECLILFVSITSESLNILHTEDTESLNVCG